MNPIDWSEYVLTSGRWFLDMALWTDLPSPGSKRCLSLRKNLLTEFQNGFSEET